MLGSRRSRHDSVAIPRRAASGAVEGLPRSFAVERAGTRHAGRALLQLLLICSVVLAGVDPTLATRPGPAQAAIAADQRAAGANVDQPSPRTKRKQDRRQERRHDRQRERKRDRARAKHDRHQRGGKKKRHNLANLCDASTGRADPCTHGTDPAPPGFAVKQDVAPLAPAAAADQASSLVCDGDGQSGFRVHLLYVHASDVPSRYAAYLASVQAWAGEADRIVADSAVQTGDERHIRFLHDSQCLPLVDVVAVSPAATSRGGFWTMIDELQRQGYSRTDRVYQAFVDANEMCGMGVVWNDDRADGAVNRHNIGPSYSRIDSGCWGGAIAAHELLHNLGGVQLSAPHSNGGFHCIDEYDVLCYQDSSRAPAPELDCQDPSADWLLLDCNHDDYFNTNPDPGSYLATHWNAANNRFLVGAPAVQVHSPPGPSTSTTNRQSGNDGKRKKSGKGKKRGGSARHHSGKRTVIKVK